MSCATSTLFRQLLVFSQAVIVSLIMTIRTYALYGRSKYLLTWMIIVMVALGGGASVGTFGHFSSNLIVWSGVGCDETYTAEIAVRLGLAWLAQLIFDLLIFVLTVYRICKTRGLLRLSLIARRNVVEIMFQDGVMYFGAMVLCNIPNILTFYVGSAATASILSPFTSCMSVTLISRLMLNLHKSINADIFSTSTRDDDYAFPVLTTRVDVQSVISSHNC
ncbi:hypothetical protein DFH29DRAFT_512331 [Suillus ampliporus]|nr:hypothetical protein DFH29DRAFT_512331 [Suillus ampliporus]